MDGFEARLLELGSLAVAGSDGFLDVELSISPGEPGYDYSKLYYACRPDEPYDEARVICFRMVHAGRPERHRFLLPEAVRRTGYIRLRLDALPYTRGRALVGSIALVAAEDRSEASLRAERLDLKQRTRAGVEESERTGRARLPHLPESISLELTAGCNLTCSHCSSHGVPEAHAMNNRRKAFDGGMLDRLAEDAFPALSLVNLVGRGEPMMVGLPLWNKLIAHLRANDILFTCVTNGTFLRRRIDASTLPVIDTLTCSIDGTTPEVFGANRGGASLDVWMDNVAYFNELRAAPDLARPARLGLSWTLKRNNIEQFPDFIRLAIRLKANLLYIRHLFVFHEKDRSQSLVAEPALTNRYLREGYALLKGHAIKLDAVPLSDDLATRTAS